MINFKFKNVISPSVILTVLVSLSFITASNSVYAEAGRVVFAYGEVTAESSNGRVRRLTKRSLVEPGETIRTSKNSLVQMRMIDKAIIALRSNSAVTIESYKLGATKNEDVGLFSLLKGGFRAVTGIIGKRLRSAYKMKTLTATIGIRGTDYTARLCDNDCNQNFSDLASAGQIADGLYVGVNDGGIDLTNKLGTLSLDELQFGYVKDATTAPVALISAPEFLYFNSKAPNPDEQSENNESEKPTQESKVVASRSKVEPESSDITTDDNIKQDLKADNVEVAQEQIEKNVTIDQVAVTESGNSFSLTDGTISSSRMVVTSYGKQGATGSVSKVHSNPFNSATVTDQNDLTKFENNFLGGGNAVGTYNAGSATTIDLGYDPVTGIAWGRWAAGAAQFQSAGNALDAATLSSVHWLASPDQSQNIALPSSGTQSFQWVGNTTPTDNLGNSGILGNATLDANFTNMTVDSAVAIGINNNVWNATATDMAITNNGGFSGNMDTVNVNTGAETISGTGNAAGFFTNNATGAGLGFSLEATINSVDTTVTGTAAFQK